MQKKKGRQTPAQSHEKMIHMYMSNQKVHYGGGKIPIDNGSTQASVNF